MRPQHPAATVLTAPSPTPDVAPMRHRPQLVGFAEVTTPTPSPPTPKPTSRPAPPKIPASPKGSVREQVAHWWPGDDRWALDIVDCESGFNISADNPSPESTASGLWGFLDSTWQTMGGSGRALGKPVKEQTQRAWKLYVTEGPSQWQCKA